MILGASALTQTFAQGNAFDIRVVRNIGLAEALNRNECIFGTLYRSPGFSLLDYGSEICKTLELPYRDNVREISSIPEGNYVGFVRTDGALGWRIEFENVDGNRTFIQIHPGNITDDTLGCVLVGLNTEMFNEHVMYRRCRITDSRAAIARIRDAYGPNDARPIQIKVQTG
ncbi:MAG: DUF5675 family protein [Gammaproteobacteria bacterium]|nr:DUF5675 family protein [Gammaproteobacteria bacterium]